MIVFEFADQDEGIPAIAAARLFCDLQHLALVALIPELSAVGEPIEHLLTASTLKYENMIRVHPLQILPAVINLQMLSYNSPLSVGFDYAEVGRKIAQAAKRNIAVIADRTIFYDLERRKREVEIAKSEAEVMTARIANLAAALDVMDKIPDQKLRELYMAHVLSATNPFTHDHPPLKTIEFQARTHEPSDPPSSPGMR